MGYFRLLTMYSVVGPGGFSPQSMFLIGRFALQCLPYIDTIRLGLTNVNDLNHATILPQRTVGRLQIEPGYHVHCFILPLVALSIAALAAVVVGTYDCFGGSIAAIMIGFSAFTLALWRVALPRISTSRQLDVLTFVLVNTSFLLTAWVTTVHPHSHALAILAIVMFASFSFVSDAALVATVSLGIFSQMAAKLMAGIEIDAPTAIELLLLTPFLAILIRCGYFNMRRLMIAIADLKEHAAIELEEARAQLKSEETLRRQAVIQLYQAQKSESLSSLAGGIAMDFHNLLIAITEFAESIARNTTQKRLVEDAEQIKALAMRASRTCGQMLTYAGKSTENRTMVSLRDLLREMSPLIEAALPADVRLKMELSRNPLIVQADLAHLRQAIFNVLLNAGEAMPSTGGHVFIESRLVDADTCPESGRIFGGSPPAGEHLCISISDDGMGMDETTLMQAFDPYSTAKPRRNGFGLPVALGIVRSHGGVIRGQSTPGCGSKFDILLPPAARAAETMLSSTPKFD